MLRSMGSIDEILATIRRLPLPERLRLIERATLEASCDCVCATTKSSTGALSWSFAEQLPAQELGSRASC
jgi:hypothetical protein